MSFVSLVFTEQGFIHPDALTLPDVGALLEAVSAEDHDRGSMTEMAHLIALPEGATAGDPIRPAVLEVEPDVEDSKWMLATRTAATGTGMIDWQKVIRRRGNDGSFVLAVRPLDPLQRDRVDVPGTPYESK